MDLNSDPQRDKSKQEMPSGNGRFYS